jgi:plasmid stabilization system protein ParE
MGHIRTPQADSDLDDIWYYVATNSGSVETADRFVDYLTDRFFLLASHPNIGRTRVLRAARDLPALFEPLSRRHVLTCFLWQFPT